MAQTTINKLPDILTDEQINSLEQQDVSSDVLTDEQIQRLEQPQIEPIVEKPSLYGKISEGMKKFSTGFAKGELQTVQGLSRLGSFVGEKLNLPGQIAEFATGGKIQAPQRLPIFSENFAQTLKPQGALETTGNVIEKVAEFLAPSKIIQNTTKSLAQLASQGISDSTLKWLTSTGVKSAVGALTTGFQTSMQREGRIDNAVKINALISALIPPIASGFSALGKKIGFSVIKPSQADIRDVKGNPSDATKIFADNIYKHDLGGSLRETALKSETKLQELSQRLTNTLKNSKETVDLSNSYYETFDELYNAKKTFGNTEAINNSLGRLAKEIDNVTGGKPTATDLLSANQIKQGAGAKGAWVFGRLDPESAADEIVYSKFYSKLRDNIDKIGSPIIQKINSLISEIIPIRNAVLRRIPVAERNNLLGITTDMGLFASIFDPRALALVAAEQMSKSGRFANFLVKAADNYGVRKGGGSLIKAGISSFLPTNQPEMSEQKIPLLPRER